MEPDVIAMRSPHSHPSNDTLIHPANTTEIIYINLVNHFNYTIAHKLTLTTAMHAQHQPAGPINAPPLQYVSYKYNYDLHNHCVFTSNRSLQSHIHREVDHEHRY